MDNSGEEAHAPIIITGRSLSLGEVDLVARQCVQVEISKEALDKVQASAEVISSLSTADEPVYGVNTGFGIFSNRRIEFEQISLLTAKTPI